MQKGNVFRSVLVSWALLFPVPSLAAIVIQNASAGGPGGGAVVIGTSDNGFTINVGKSFTSIAPIDVVIPVNSAGVYTLNEAPGPNVGNGVLNNTGLTWIDFEFMILSAPAGTTFNGGFEGPGPGSGPRFDPPTISDSLVHFAGGTGVAPLNPLFGFNPVVSFSAPTAGTITIREIPSVPEPSTWVMMMAGFAAVGAAMRASKRRTVAALA